MLFEGLLRPSAYALLLASYRINLTLIYSTWRMGFLQYLFLAVEEVKLVQHLLKNVLKNVSSYVKIYLHKHLHRLCQPIIVQLGCLGTHCGRCAGDCHCYSCGSHTFVTATLFTSPNVLVLVSNYEFALSSNS